MASPVAFALLQLGYAWGSALVAAGVIVGLTSTMLMIYYALTRMVFAMARDGLLPAFFSVLHPRSKTPVNATVLGGFVMAALAGIAPLTALAQLVNAGTLVEFVLVCAAVILLRRRTDLARPFRAPGGVVIAIAGIAACGALLAFLPAAILEGYALCMAVGLVFYFALRRAGVSAANASPESVVACGGACSGAAPFPKHCGRRVHRRAGYVPNARGRPTWDFPAAAVWRPAPPAARP